MTSLLPLLGLGSLLASLGIGGSLLTAASILFTAWKGKHILDVLSRVGVWVRIGGAVLVGVLVATTGIIPGVELSIDFATVGQFAGDIWSAVKGVLPF